MKTIYLKIILVLSLFLFSNLSNSQIIIKRGEKGINGVLPDDFQSSGNYYYKDINNYLDNFTGTWQYVNGNEKFQIVLTKVIKYHVVIPLIDLNYYEDRIVLRYKKFVNNNLVFESPIYETPDIISTDGLLLKGNVTDYGRITKTIYMPFPRNSTEVFLQGGQPIYPICRIERLMTLRTEPKKIKFSLSLTNTPNYDRETYAGQPTFSIPNDIEMVKVNWFKIMVINIKRGEKGINGVLPDDFQSVFQRSF